VLLKGPLKRSFGAAADSLGDCIKADAAFDQSGRDLHTPAPEYRVAGSPA
jgi:hypothetical protein